MWGSVCVTILWTQKGCLLCELDCRHVCIRCLLSLLNIKMFVRPVAWPCNAISRQFVTVIHPKNAIYPGVFHVIVFLYLFIYAIHVHLVFFLGLCQILTWWYRKRKRYIQTCSLYGYSKELILKCFVSSLWFLLMFHLASGVRSREWTS